MKMAFLVLIGAALLVLLTIEGVRVIGLLQESRQLVASNQPFEARPDNAQMRVLVIGDSLAAGVGASDPKESLAGRISGLLPGAEVINEGVSGAKIADVHEALLAQGEDAQFDFIFITAGANDILRLTSLDQAEAEMDALLAEASKRGNYVMLLTCGNMGLAPIFPPLASTFYSHRAQQALPRFAQVAGRHNVAMVDLYYEEENDPFAQDEQRYYASDKFHPSGAGYGVWFNDMVEVLQQENE